MKTLKGGAMDSHLLLEIYNKQAKMIYFYLKKNGCSHEDAEDIVQESYTKFIVVVFLQRKLFLKFLPLL